MANILDVLFSETGLAISGIIEIFCTVSLLLFMHFSAKYRNYKLSIGWYIAGFLFPLITAFVFLSKRKKFPGPKMKVCPFCGDKFPDVYQVCGRCLIELPENKTEDKQKENRIAKIFGWLFTVVFSAGAIVTVAALVVTVMYIFDSIDSLDSTFLSDSNRISCLTEDGSRVYYDKIGNTYEDGYDVLLYGKDGEIYKYLQSENDNELGFSETYYVSENGDCYDSYNCYIDEDGYFFYDEDETLVYPEYLYEDIDTDEVADEIANELIGAPPETFRGMIDFFIEEFFGALEYKYYNDYYVDEDDNKYYWAEEASWNEKGELITAENDPEPIE